MPSLPKLVVLLSSRCSFTNCSGCSAICATLCTAQTSNYVISLCVPSAEGSETPRAQRRVWPHLYLWTISYCPYSSLSDRVTAQAHSQGDPFDPTARVFRIIARNLESKLQVRRHCTSSIAFTFSLKYGIETVGISLQDDSSGEGYHSTRVILP